MKVCSVTDIGPFKIYHTAVAFAGDECPVCSIHMQLKFLKQQYKEVEQKARDLEFEAERLRMELKNRISKP